MIGAFTTLFSLSAEQKKLLKVKQIQDERVIEEWIKLFTTIADFDKQGDSGRNWGCGCAITGFILTIISIPLIAAYIGLLTLPIAILMLIIGLIAYFFLKGYDVPGEKLTNSVLPILKVLQEDMNPNEKLKLRLDMRGFEFEEKKTGESQKYDKGVYYNCVDFYYRDHWMEGQATLVDGTQLIWNVYDLVRNTRKTKRNYRGKIKTKYKPKHRTYIMLQAGMKNEKYILQDNLKEKGQAGKIVINDSGKRSWVTIRRTIKHPSGYTFAPEDFLMTVASAYNRAGRKGIKK